MLFEAKKCCTSRAAATKFGVPRIVIKPRKGPAKVILDEKSLNKVAGCPRLGVTLMHLTN